LSLGAGVLVVFVRRVVVAPVLPVVVAVQRRLEGLALLKDSLILGPVLLVFFFLVVAIVRDICGFKGQRLRLRLRLGLRFGLRGEISTSTRIAG
jgi:hypothetical protein